MSSVVNSWTYKLRSSYYERQTSVLPYYNQPWNEFNAPLILKLKCPNVQKNSLWIVNIHLWSWWCLSPLTPCPPDRLCHLPPGVHIHILLGQPSPHPPCHHGNYPELSWDRKDSINIVYHLSRWDNDTPPVSVRSETIKSPTNRHKVVFQFLALVNRLFQSEPSHTPSIFVCLAKLSPALVPSLADTRRCLCPGSYWASTPFIGQEVSTLASCWSAAHPHLLSVDTNTELTWSQFWSPTWANFVGKRDATLIDIHTCWLFVMDTQRELPTP